MQTNHRETEIRKLRRSITARSMNRNFLENKEREKKGEGILCGCALCASVGGQESGQIVAGCPAGSDKTHRIENHRLDRP